MALNKVFLTGNVAQDFVKRSDKIGQVSIAQNIWNGKESVPHFFRVTLLGEKNVANAERLLKKGANITIEGTLVMNNWEKDGVKHSDLQINSFNFDINKFANGASDNGQNISAQDHAGEDSQDVVPDDIPEGEIDFDSIPF